MAVMLTQQQILALTQEAIVSERLRIIGVLEAAANVQQLDGDIDGAQILAEAIMLIKTPEDAPPAEEGATQESTGVEEMFTEENNQAKHEFDRELIGELPPDRLRTDEEDVAAFLAKPRMPQPLPR